MLSLRRFTAFAALILSFAAMASAQSSAPWTYAGHTGTEVWGRLDRSYAACSHGHEQSPVDMRGARLNKSLQPIEFHYIAGQIKLENDGHTVTATVRPGSYIVAEGVRYELKYFDFHHPSETPIKGKLTDMEVHLVHESADGKMAIVAVQLSEEVGKPNAVLASLWDQLPKKAGASATVTEMVSPGGLLPADRGYWTYVGSLSNPPCTEGVRWFVFEQQMSLSRDQLRAFAAIFKMNTRPAQELRGRRIEADE